jgi:transposase
MRNYPATREPDPHGRAERAARLRAEGKSLREIGAELRISPATAMRDLRRWDESRAALPANVFQLRVSSHPLEAEMKQADETGDETARTTGEVLGLTVREERIARAVAYLTGRGA